MQGISIVLVAEILTHMAVHNASDDLMNTALTHLANFILKEMHADADIMCILSDAGALLQVAEIIRGPREALWRSAIKVLDAGWQIGPSRLPPRHVLALFSFDGTVSSGCRRLMELVGRLRCPHAIASTFKVLEKQARDDTICAAELGMFCASWAARFPDIESPHTRFVNMLCFVSLELYFNDASSGRNGLKSVLGCCRHLKHGACFKRQRVPLKVNCIFHMLMLAHILLPRCVDADSEKLSAILRRALQWQGLDDMQTWQDVFLMVTSVWRQQSFDGDSPEACAAAMMLAESLGKIAIAVGSAICLDAYVHAVSW